MSASPSPNRHNGLPDSPNNDRGHALPSGSGPKQAPPSPPAPHLDNGSDSGSSSFDDVYEDRSDTEHAEPRPLPSGIPYGLKSLFIYVEYAVGLFREKAGRVPLRAGAGVLEGGRIPIDLRAEVEMLTDAVLRAWKNPVRLDFSIVEVSNLLDSGGSLPKDELLLQRFTPPHLRNPDGSLPLIDVPTVYVDKDGRVVAWYIPNAFATRRSDQITNVVRKFGEGVLSIGGDNWRESEQSYANPKKCLMPPGTGNFSVSWYNRGFNHLNSLPGPSATLKLDAGREILHRLRTINALIGILLFLVHPQAFDQAMNVFLELLQHPEKTSDPETTMAIFDDWATPFSGFALISNRETKLHRDTRGGRYSLDILSAFGSYTGGRLQVSLLGGRYVYSPGTAFVLPGYLFEHGAGQTAGERLCLASFFRPNVGRGALGKAYKDLLPPTLGFLQSTYSSRLPEVDDKDIWN